MMLSVIDYVCTITLADRYQLYAAIYQLLAAKKRTIDLYSQRPHLLAITTTSTHDRVSLRILEDIRHETIEQWLHIQGITTLPFMHIIKKQKYGSVLYLIILSVKRLL